MDERVRKWSALAAMYSGWGTSIGTGIYAVVGFDPAKGQFAPEWVSLTFIFAVGVAIAAGGAVSRIRLADTIVSAFKAGFEVSEIHRSRNDPK